MSLWGSRGVPFILGGACVLGACASDKNTSTAPAVAADPRDTTSESNDASVSPRKTATPRPAPTTPPGADPEAPPKEPTIDLYDPKLLPRFEITLDAAAVATLTNEGDAEEKTWVHGSFRYGDITFADVGVRAKGSGTYRALPGKTSLKIKFNKWVKGQKLHGLEGLTLNNSVDDPNYLRQRLTYHVFRAAGLAAPLANSAHLTINGEDYGLYANVETPDEDFLERRFGKTVHSLYEAHTPGTWMPGSASRWEIDIAQPAAPVGAMPDLDALFQAVASANDATLLEDLGAHLHTKEWLRYCAAEGVLNLFDHYAYGKYGPHNYFMAGDTAGKFHLMPWSTDDSLAPEIAVDMSAPATDVVFARCKNSDSCWSAYKTEVASVLSVYETLNLVDLAHEWHEQIDTLGTSDPKREVTLEKYTTSTNELYEWLGARPAAVRLQLGL